MERSLDILVIEDNPLNRRLIRDLMTHRGHQIREASSFEEGLAQFAEPAADVVLMDVQLPDGDGTSLLAEMRQRHAWAQVPAVAVTAFAMAGDREELLDAGFDGYRSKPIDVGSIAQYIESLVK